MKYTITMAIDGFLTWEDEAQTEQVAIDKAREKYYDADFGELENIQMDIYSVSRVKDEPNE